MMKWMDIWPHPHTHTHKQTHTLLTKQCWHFSCTQPWGSIDLYKYICFLCSLGLNCAHNNGFRELSRPASVHRSVRPNKTTVTHTHALHMTFKVYVPAELRVGRITDPEMDLVTRTKKYIHLPLLFITQWAMETRWDYRQRHRRKAPNNTHTRTAQQERRGAFWWGGASNRQNKTRCRGASMLDGWVYALVNKWRGSR